MSQKGGDYERLICRELSTWWSGGTNDDLFWRSATSGARATQRAKKGKKTSGHCGDIAATDISSLPFTKAVTVELKRGYSSRSFADVIDRVKLSAQQPWEAFVEQATTAAKLANSYSWLLIQRRDGRPSLVFMPWSLYRDLRELTSFERVPLPFIKIRAKIRTKEGSAELFDVVAMTFANFCTDAKPADFVTLSLRVRP